MANPKFRVAISGAGIGALALAVTIGKYSNIHVDIYEAGSEITKIGAGITVWARTQEIIKELGLQETLVKSALPPGSIHEMLFKRADQPEEGPVFYIQNLDKVLSMHRASLIGVFEQNLPETCKIHYSKKLTDYTQSDSGSVTLQFADGSSAETDILVGADGIWSATRAVLARDLAKEHPSVDLGNQYARPKWSGILAYRCLLQTEKFKQTYPDHQALAYAMNYCGKNKHLVSYPIAQGRLINIIAYYTVEGGEGTVYDGPSVVNVPAEELQDCYKGWDPAVVDLLKCADGASKWAIHVVDSLPYWSSNRVAILGDAAHAMTPHFGSGAGQAIEDAYVLGRLLTDSATTLDNVSKVLGVYQECRAPLAYEIVRESGVTGLLYELVGIEERDGLSEEELLKESGAAIEKKWKWEWDHGFAHNWEITQKRFREVVA